MSWFQTWLPVHKSPCVSSAGFLLAQKSREKSRLFCASKKPGKIPASVTDCNFSIQGIS